MKKIVAVILMIVCCFNFAFADVTDGLNKAYDRVQKEYPEFISRLLEQGAQEDEIKSFISDVGNELAEIRGLNVENFEAEMTKVLKNVLLSGKYNNLQGAINRAYFDEINYLIETGKIPESLIPLKDILMDCILNSKDNDGNGYGNSGGGGSVGNDTSDDETDEPERNSLNFDETYNVFSILYPDFVNDFLEMGVTEVEIKTFLTDVSVQLSKIDGLDEENFESNMKNVLADVLLSGKHNKLQNVMQNLYFDEILEMISTGNIPEKFIPLRDTLLICLLDKDSVPSLFVDVEDEHWAYSYVQGMAIKGIVKGKGDRKFEPDTSVTREEFVKMIVSVKGLDLNVEDIENPFTDVSENEWYYPYVLAAYRDGIISGISSDTFGTGNSIARQDAAVILARVLSANDTTGIELFDDDAQIADYAKDSVYALSKIGIIGGMGDGTFRPYGVTTRAQAAKILSSLD